MLLTVTLRTDKTFAQTHIVNDLQRVSLCGKGVPPWLTFEDQGSAQNPYVGRNPVSCGECIALFESGVRTANVPEVKPDDPIPE